MEVMIEFYLSLPKFHESLICPNQKSIRNDAFLKPGIEFQFNSELEKKSKGGLLIRISWNVVGGAWQATIQGPSKTGEG